MRYSTAAETKVGAAHNIGMAAYGAHIIPITDLITKNALALVQERKPEPHQVIRIGSLWDEESEDDQGVFHPIPNLGELYELQGAAIVLPIDLNVPDGAHWYYVSADGYGTMHAPTPEVLFRPMGGSRDTVVERFFDRLDAFAKEKIYEWPVTPQYFFIKALKNLYLDTETEYLVWTDSDLSMCRTRSNNHGIALTYKA